MHPSRQFRNIAPLLVMVFASTTAVLSVVIFLGIENKIALDHFTQDPASIMNTPFYLGFFSYIGILFWCGAAAVCFFTRYIMPSTEENRRKKQFLLYSGLITCLFLFDDLFLLHEEVFPEYFFLPENMVYLIYVNAILFYMILFRNELLQSEYLVLLLAFG